MGSLVCCLIEILVTRATVGAGLFIICNFSLVDGVEKLLD